ncbi:MAG: patatin-like phospholipase family protein [Patescibacteria group bacterium]|nr:patatin-like phospholipase family protein [Patescibacteria group bacterium]
MKKRKYDYPVLDPVLIGDDKENMRENWIKDAQVPSSINQVILKARKAIVLVLSGGAMKAFAQVGAYRELHMIISKTNETKNTDLKVDAVVSSSGGSFAGAAICCGWSPDELEEEAKKSIWWRNLVKLDIGRTDQLVSMEPLEDLVRGWGAETFEELRIPEIVVAYQLDEGAVLGWGSEPVASWVRASCSMIYRVSPLKFVDKQDQRVAEMVDASDYSDNWKNPVKIARCIFPNALIINIDLSRKSSVFSNNDNIVSIRPFAGINPVEDFRYTFTKRCRQAIERGVVSVKKQKDVIEAKLERLI